MINRHLVDNRLTVFGDYTTEVNVGKLPGVKSICIVISGQIVDPFKKCENISPQCSGKKNIKSEDRFNN